MLRIVFTPGNWAVPKLVCLIECFFSPRSMCGAWWVAVAAVLAAGAADEALDPEGLLDIAAGKYNTIQYNTMRISQKSIIMKNTT